MMATYPPQGLQSRSSFSSLDTSVKTITVGANLNSLSNPPYQSLSAGLGGFGETTYAPVQADYTPTVQGTSSSAYNAAAQFITVTYTPPVGRAVRSVWLSFDCYTSFNYQSNGANNTVQVNIYNAAFPSTPQAFIQPLQASLGNSPLSLMVPVSTHLLYTPANLIVAPITFNLCAFTISGASAATILSNTSTRHPFSLVVYSRVALTTVYQ